MTLRTQGIPQSFPVTGLVAPAVAVLMNLTVGHGLWHLRPWGRRVAIGWDGLVAILSALIAGWQWKYHAAVRLDQWPDYLVSDGLPWFLLAVMLMPRTRAVFAIPPETVSPARGRSSPLTWIAALLLLVVISTILVDAAGWAAGCLAAMRRSAPSLPSPDRSAWFPGSVSHRTKKGPFIVRSSRFPRCIRREVATFALSRSVPFEGSEEREKR